jgi:hypothetical protein
MRFQRNSGSTATTFGYLAYNVESVDWIPLAGRPVTFSFHARAGANFSPSSSVLNFRLATGTGTDQNLNNTGFTGQVNTDSTATLTTSWQRYTTTITAPSSTTQFGVQFWSQFTGTAGANDWYEITGVQLESGTVATPFKRNAPSIAAELAACQRYYQRYQGGIGCSLSGAGYSGSEILMGFSLPVPMRTTISASISGQIIVSDQYTSDPIASSAAMVALQGATNNGGRFLIGGFSGIVTGRFYSTPSVNVGGGSLQFSAEL